MIDTTFLKLFCLLILISAGCTSVNYSSGNISGDELVPPLIFLEKIEIDSLFKSKLVVVTRSEESKRDKETYTLVSQREIQPTISKDSFFNNDDLYLWFDDYQHHRIAWGLQLSLLQKQNPNDSILNRELMTRFYDENNQYTDTFSWDYGSWLTTSRAYGIFLIKGRSLTLKSSEGNNDFFRDYQNVYFKVITPWPVF